MSDRSRMMLLPLLVSILATTSVADSGPQVPYRASLEGVDTRKLQAALKERSLTFRLQDHPPASLGQLRRRMADDLPRLADVLHSRGYYDASVEAGIDSNAVPLDVTFTVTTGAIYALGDIAVEFVDVAGGIPILTDDFELR